MLISQSLHKDYLDTQLDIVSYDNKRIKLDLTKRRIMLVKITGLEDKPIGEERSCYNLSSYVTYTPLFHFSSPPISP